MSLLQCTTALGITVRHRISLCLVQRWQFECLFGFCQVASADAPSETTSSFRDRPVAEWTVKEVTTWCSDVESVADLGPKLEAKAMTGSMLLSITAENVKSVTGLRGALQCK